MNNIKYISLFIIGWLCLAPRVHAQDAIAITSDPGPALHVALNWGPAGNAVRYNIYRKKQTDAAYPLTPVNAAPIQPAGSCATIRSLLITTPDSLEWKMVARALSDSVLFNPCLMNTVPKTSAKYNRLLFISRSIMPVAIAAGLGFKDNTATLNQAYHYRIDALDASNNVVSIVAVNLLVVAGVPELTAVPSGIVAEAGDAMVQVRWIKVPRAAGYVLERATQSNGTYQQVNDSRYATRINNHLNGDTLIPAAEGMLDFQRYDAITGKAIAHKVNNIWIAGPKNGLTYYYRVRSVDLFNRRSLPSVVSNAALPKDSTKPSVPIDLVTVPDNVTGRVNIRWTQVVYDINGHREEPDSTVRYRVYRFTSSDDPATTPSKYIGEVGPAKGLQTKDTTDADPLLQAPYGNRTWWYRVRAVDAAGNIGQWSSAVSAIVKDKTAPDIVYNVTAAGSEEYISVKWKLNTEPDIASYMVYRSLCHLGSWVECNPKDTCTQWVKYDPTGTKPVKDKDRAVKIPCPCSGPFVFLGEITQDSANRASTAGNIFFRDSTIPRGSPLCYAYWIKAKDSSDNISGAFPLPSAGERTQIVCERLRDLTAPEPALIAGLLAQADRIRIEWMGPPTQDTRAYHVYRAQGADPSKEPLVKDFKWAGGTTIELPPNMPVKLVAPYKPPGLAACDKISVQATPWMSQGSFEDTTIDPKLTYWYRVAGIDYDGNETPLDKSAAISTFTFSRKTPPSPVLDALTKLSAPSAVQVKWLPIYDPLLHKGFIVYRSTSATGPFTPIVTSPVRSNSFTDYNVVSGETYWYRIGILMNNARLSELTPPQNITP